ncbi:hypothetical protein DBR42_27310 [Pelomonas sp. HMWF004]|nr:hypothetical protein DBR42_27310 [Pelomonas sp. HMWF004]
MAASLDEALVAPAASGADLLLWQSSSLPASVPAALAEAASAWGAGRVAVVYRFAAAESRKAFTSAGIAVLCEPSDDEALGAWLASLQVASDVPPAPPAVLAEPRSAIPPRRFDDAALTAIAGLSPNLACECPRHVAELLMQLAGFEAYSAACLQRSPADAELHAYLQQVAGASRSLFESALERVARHEGLSLG